MTNQAGVMKARAKIEKLKEELKRTNDSALRLGIINKISRLHNLFTTEPL